MRRNLLLFKVNVLRKEQELKKKGIRYLIRAEFFDTEMTSDRQ